MVSICKTNFLGNLSFNSLAQDGESALTEASMDNRISILSKESESDISVSFVATFCDTPNTVGDDYRKR